MLTLIPRRSRGWFGLIAFAAALLPARAEGQPEIRSVGGGRFRVEFVCNAPAGTRSVHLAGTFNGWSPTADAMTGPDTEGRFVIAMDLPGGRHEYKFVLDGPRWITDEGNPHRVPPHDNAVVQIGEPATGGTPESAATPVDMIPLDEHPAAIAAIYRSGRVDERQFEARLQKAGLAGGLPFFTDRTMSFVVRVDEDETARLHVAGHGFEHYYTMSRSADGGNVYAVTLRREPKLIGAVYEFEITRGDSQRVVLDARARMQTSRNGRPVSVIAPDDPARGRILYLGRVDASTGAVPSRDVYAYLPPGYDREPGRRYPVVYMHDGQNCWDDPIEPFGHGGWQVNATADRLIAGGEIEPFIGVGIANSPQRIREYGPGSAILSTEPHPYMAYLLRDVKPMIDGRFRTRPDRESTFSMGASLGGVISFQLALRHPEVFGGAACLSSAFWVKDAQGRGYFDLLAAVGRQPVRLYIDSGTVGINQDGAADTRRMAEALRAAGWTEADLLHHEAEGAAHNEQAWRARVDKPLRFLLETPKSQHVKTPK